MKDLRKEHEKKRGKKGAVRELAGEKTVPYRVMTSYWGGGDAMEELATASE